MKHIIFGIMFALMAMSVVALEVHSPVEENYENGDILVNISANQSNVSYSVDGVNGSCENCSELIDHLNLTPGDYTLIATSMQGNNTEEVTVDFTVIEPMNETDGNETDDGNQTRPRFTRGLNKLPQAVEAGEIENGELASIIRNNSLNPGVINRLSKTGKLGNESIDAILETQRTPPGILRKVLGFFGFQWNTAKENLAEHYPLTEEQKIMLIVDEDTSDGVAEELQEELSKKTKSKIPPGLARKAEIVDVEETEVEEEKPEKKELPEKVKKMHESNTSEEKRTPPGLEKKEMRESNTSEEERMPPGLAKKAFKAGRQR